MAFTKTAKLSFVSIAEGQFDSDSNDVAFKRQANRQEASVYQGGSRKIDIKAMLDMVAKEYDISADPKDYIFEAARAVTAEVPNENGDAFPRSELLRFDHRLGKKVYQTFVLKPHHINHKADNPRTSRGLVLDASYNDSAEALAECPGCSAKTASVDARDSSGVNCKKCGHVVKDEFVELLIAIDTKKDPAFAKGVKSGSLNSLSMGCEAGYTDCSICDNRARTVGQFCSHIKSGNKKKIFKTASGPKMSFEKCGEVMFTEISRVDQPADPTALQREVFTAVPNMGGEHLLTASRLDKIASKLSKGAQLVGDDATAIDPSRLEELKGMHPELYTELKQKHPELFEDNGEPVPGPMAIDDYEKKRQESSEKNMSAAEMGFKPEMGSGLAPTAASKVAGSINADLSALIAGTEVLEDKTVSTTLKFANAYQNLEVEVTGKGNVRVFSPKGTLFVVRPTEKPADRTASEQVATEVLMHIAEHGLVATATKYKSVLNSKIAQVLEFHLEDFDGGRDDGGKKPMTEGGDGDGQLQARGKPAKNLQEGGEGDGQLQHREKPAKDTLSNEIHNHQEKLDKPADSITDNADDDLNKERSKAPKTTLDSGETDRADKQPKNASTKAAELPDFLKKKDEDKSEGKADEKEEKKEAQMAVPPPPQGAAAPAPGTPGAPVAPQMEMTSCGCGAPGCESCAKEKKASDELPPELKTAAAKKHMSRVERIYKARLQKTEEDSAKKLANLEKDATSKVQAKLLRALKLAAKRQALNLEESPIKAKMFDVLASSMDIDHDSYYPGMDAEVAARLIEATADGSFDAFIDSILKRASEFLSMNDEALASIEADVKNLRPATVTVQAAVAQSKTAARQEVRTAAVSGNLVVAPAATDEGISNGNKRDNIRVALDTTKVRRTSQAYFNK
jgi:hypothetical protein